MTRNDCQRCHSLQAACDEAVDTYPNSCSHAVWHVIRKYIPDQPYLTANTLVVHLETSPHWEEVQMVDISRLANDGALIVGGLTGISHGHVIVAYPGQPKFDGGYHFKTKEGKQVLAKGHAVYPLAMSTSMGSWPGAKSRGDKTVVDPWPREQFHKVRFWKFKGK